MSAFQDHKVDILGGVGCGDVCLQEEPCLSRVAGQTAWGSATRGGELRCGGTVVQQQKIMEAGAAAALVRAVGSINHQHPPATRNFLSPQQETPGLAASKQEYKHISCVQQHIAAGSSLDLAAAAAAALRQLLLQATHGCCTPILPIMVSGTRQLAQHVVREFFALVSPQLANPWTVYGPSKAGIFTATIQAPALPPLCTGGTFSNKHKQQVCAWRPWRLLPSDRSPPLPTHPPPNTSPLGAAVTVSSPCVLQAMAVGNVCERYLQHLADSGVLTHGWRRWPQTWMQEGGEAAHECSMHAGSCSQCTHKTHCQQHQA